MTAHRARWVLWYTAAAIAGLALGFYAVAVGALLGVRFTPGGDE